MHHVRHVQMLTHALGVRIICSCGMVSVSRLKIIMCLIFSIIIIMQGVNTVPPVVIHVMIYQLMRDVSNVIYGVKIKYASMTIKT